MKKLQEALLVGKKRTINRLVMPPMASSRAQDSGLVSEAILDYYRPYAVSGKLGLIITEHSYVSPEGKASLNQMSIASDDCIPGLKTLTELLKSEGSLAICQINHAGSQTNEETTGLPVVGPTAMDHPNREPFRLSPVHELDGESIDRLVEAYCRAAQRAREAGFDGVEVHSAHGYLLNQFYSPLTNRRGDLYGPSSIENRVRFHQQILEAIRSEIGDDFLVGLRLGGCDYADGGSSLEDSAEAVKQLENLLDYVSLTGGIFGYRKANLQGPGYYRDMSQAVKSVTDLPVILTGGVVEAVQADELLDQGLCDLVGVGRAILRNPAWLDDIPSPGSRPDAD